MAELIKTRIRKDLIYNLEGITEGNGFYHTIADVYGLSRSEENQEEFPSIQVEFTSFENEALGAYQYDWIANVDLTVSLKTDDPDTDRETIVSDIQSKFFENVKTNLGVLPNAEGVSICRDLAIQRIVFLGIEETKPLHKVVITLELKFSESLDDSTALP